jgi:hypothetical protein
MNFYELVKEMRKAQKAYAVNMSPLKKTPKEEYEKAVDKALKIYFEQEEKSRKQEPSLF